jgi:hypothetical protein
MTRSDPRVTDSTGECSRTARRHPPHARLPIVFVVHATKKLLDRVGGPTVSPVDQSTTALGDWYATVLFWKPHVALFVNESTLLPVLTRFAPAATVIDRFSPTLAMVLEAHGLRIRSSSTRSQR